MNRAIEWEANEFACELLMPNTELIEHVDKNFPEQIIDIEQIAKHFNVTTQMVRIRGKMLGLWDYMR